MYNRILLFALVIGVVCSLLLTGCIMGASEKNKRKQTEDVGNIIIKAFEERDEESLKSVLSVSALNSADLDDGIKYCFDLLADSIVNVEKYGFPVRDHFDSGKQSKLIKCSYNLTVADGSEYFLEFYYYDRNDFSQDEIGVTQIKLSPRDLSGEYKSVADYDRAGIYNPSWDTDVL